LTGSILAQSEFSYEQVKFMQKAVRKAVDELYEQTGADLPELELTPLAPPVAAAPQPEAESFDLVAPPNASSTPPVASADAASAPTLAITPLVEERGSLTYAAGVGAVLGAGGILIGAVYRARSDKTLQQITPDFGMTQIEAERLHGQAVSFNRRANVAFVAGGALAFTAAVTLLLEQFVFTPPPPAPPSTN